MPAPMSIAQALIIDLLVRIRPVKTPGYHA